MRRFMLLFFGWMSHKTATAAAAGAAAVVPSVVIGADPVAWALGAVAGAFMVLRADSTSRATALTNGAISAFLGGLVAPLVGVFLLRWLDIDHIHGVEYPIAFLMGLGWPWIIKNGLPMLKELLPFGRRVGGRYYD